MNANQYRPGIAGSSIDVKHTLLCGGSSRLSQSA
jgi:hypothetical protein